MFERRMTLSASIGACTTRLIGSLGPLFKPLKGRVRERVHMCAGRPREPCVHVGIIGYAVLSRIQEGADGALQPSHCTGCAGEARSPNGEGKFYKSAPEMLKYPCAF
eukprot:1158208-Pelagomonas_calceolata.AAC.54